MDEEVKSQKADEFGDYGDSDEEGLGPATDVPLNLGLDPSDPDPDAFVTVDSSSQSRRISVAKVDPPLRSNELEPEVLRARKRRSSLNDLALRDKESASKEPDSVSLSGDTATSERRTGLQQRHQNAQLLSLETPNLRGAQCEEKRVVLQRRVSSCAA